MATLDDRGGTYLDVPIEYKGDESAAKTTQSTPVTNTNKLVSEDAQFLAQEEDLSKAIIETTASTTVAQDSRSPEQGTVQSPSPIAAANPPTTRNISDNNKPPKTVNINVVSDYDWTLSLNKKNLSSTIPYIKMREMKIASSNIVSSLFTSLFAIPDGIKASQNAIDKIGNVVSGLFSTETNDIISTIKSTTLGPLLNGIKSASDFTVEKIAKLQADQQANYGSASPEFSEDLQKVLGLLYLTKPTGSVYTLPYFSNELFSVANNFMDTYEGTNGLEKTAQGIFDTAVESVRTYAGLTEPGTYIQRPKFYQFSPSGSIISFKLTLFNTLHENAYLKNNAFIAGLITANMPKRLDRVLIDPPSIYEVLIPGRAFYPYCYIKALKVDHVGVKRVLNINGTDNIIPDAYTIDFQIESLVTDISNLYTGQLALENQDSFTAALKSAQLIANRATSEVITPY